MPSRARKPPKPNASIARTREAIMGAVRSLLEEGTFHQASVDEIADRAGVSRASLYQHFGSRMGLIDAICTTLDESAELQAIRASLNVSDAMKAFDQLVRHAVRFWAAEEMLHRQLYGVAEVDSAARAFIERQTEDRRHVFGHALARLNRQEALPLLLVVTSFATYADLKNNSGLDASAVETAVVHLAHFAIGDPKSI